jgi:hypothetical protein
VGAEFEGNADVLLVVAKDEEKRLPVPEACVVDALNLGLILSNIAGENHPASNHHGQANKFIRIKRCHVAHQLGSG